MATLLEALERQTVDPAFRFDVVVVDNDEHRSSELLVRGFAERGSLEVAYHCEPERNISLARNRAVRNASGNLIAFIDDDERPESSWLACLYRTLRAHSADGVLGPVLPDFPVDAPGWLRKARLFERRRHPTGTRISEGDARTGNVLLDRGLFGEGERWFDSAFGRTGGEDSDFFARQLSRGRTFIWCDEAVVYETVPPERWTGTFHVKRLWRAGTIDGEWMREGRLPARKLVPRNLLILGACIVAIVPSLVMPKHLRVRVAQKLAYCGGVVTAYLGVSMMRQRE